MTIIYPHYFNCKEKAHTCNLHGYSFIFNLNVAIFKLYELRMVKISSLILRYMVNNLLNFI